GGRGDSGGIDQGESRAFGGGGGHREFDESVVAIPARANRAVVACGDVESADRFCALAVCGGAERSGVDGNGRAAAAGGDQFVWRGRGECARGGGGVEL